MHAQQWIDIDRATNRLYATEVLGWKLIVSGSGSCDVYRNRVCRFVCGENFIETVGRKKVTLALMNARGGPAR